MILGDLGVTVAGFRDSFRTPRGKVHNTASAVNVKQRVRNTQSLESDTISLFNEPDKCKLYQRFPSNVR